MARKGYILTRSDNTDITSASVVLDQISVRDLDTKVEIETIPLAPVDPILKSGHPTESWVPQSLCLTPDGFLYAGCHGFSGAYAIWKIDPETGTSTYQQCVAPNANIQIANWADSEFIYNSSYHTPTSNRFQVNRRDNLSLVSDTLFTTTNRVHGVANNGICWWVADNVAKTIQKRNLSSFVFEGDYPYPTGYETASFYCLQIDPENPTHLWLQGEMGTNGVIVVWDTATQTIVSEWSSADILRWKDQQFAVGGADIPVPGELHFLTLPTITGTTLLPLLIKNNNDYWASALIEVAEVIGGVTGPFSACTQGTGGDTFPWLGPFEETLKHFSWKAGDDFSPGSHTVVLHMKLEKVV